MRNNATKSPEPLGIPSGCGVPNRIQEVSMEKRKKMERTLENEVENFLRCEVEKHGGRCQKFLPDYARGWPDRIVLLPDGVLVWVETKRPVGGVLDGPQLVAHEILRRLGQRVEVVWTKAEAEKLVHELVNT